MSESKPELTVTFQDGEAKVIRSNLRLVGSDAVFEVEGTEAQFVAGIPQGDVQETIDEVRKLPFIDSVCTEGLGPAAENTDESERGAQ